MTENNLLLESQIEVQLNSIELLKEALQKLQDLKGDIEHALDYNPQRDHYRAYGGYGIEQLLGNGNPYDGSIHTLIQAAEQEIEFLKSQVK
jgi:hypothetical protein